MKNNPTIKTLEDQRSHLVDSNTHGGMLMFDCPTKEGLFWSELTKINNNIRKVKNGTS